MQELLNNVSVKRVIDPGTYKSGTDPVNVLVDRQGFESLMFALNTATVTDAQTLGITHGDAANGSDQAAVADADLIFAKTQSDSTYFKTMAAGDDNVTKKLGYKGTKRSVTITCSGAGSTGAAFAVVGILGHPRHAPVA